MIFKLSYPDFIRQTKLKHPDLGSYLETVCHVKLCFEGDHPLVHSSQNHIHLWQLEYESDDHPWINSSYREAFVKCIFEAWRVRLKQYAPYKEQGYRLYLYDDLAPTVSVVANTAHGCPYGDVTTVHTLAEVLATYEGRSWRALFSDDDWEINPDLVLKVIKKQKGSISRPTANTLGLKPGKLRLLIINMGLEDEVNQIRKRYKRRPADFSEGPFQQQAFTIYEQILPAQY